jgi:uncharacterized membrane protein YbjE (DUF340 family)
VIAAADAPSAPRPRWLKTVMIVVSVGYAALFAFSLLLAMVSPFAFDSGDTPRNWNAFLAMISFPLVVIAGIVFGWCAYGFRRFIFIPVGFALPLVYLVIFFISFS